MPTSRRRRLPPSAAGVLAGARRGRCVGLGWPAAVVGAAQRCDLRLARHVRLASAAASLAFVLDSTWALPMTAAALVTHAVARGPARAGRLLAELSRRANRHVYARGFRVRPGFMITIGNTVNGAGDNALTSAASPATRHRPRGRPRVAGALVRSAVPRPVRRLDGRRRRHRRRAVGGTTSARAVRRVVETCGYYLNPFEWWAYSRGGTWPPPKKVDRGRLEPCAAPAPANER